MQTRRVVALLVVVATLAGCTSPDDGSGELHLQLVQGPDTVTPGTVIPQAIVVKVVDGDGGGVAGVPVTWSIGSGGGTLSASADTSGVDGLAGALWTPGLAASSQEVLASIYDQPALRITAPTAAFHADRMDAGWGGVCGIQGTATWCWVRGRNDNQTYRILSQVQAKTLALSDNYACVVDVAGATYCHTYGRFSQRTEPDEYRTITGLPPISEIASGDNYFCGIDAADRTPWCWTGGFFGANHVSATLALTSITAGNNYGCGLTDDGAAWCWTSFDAPVAVPGGHTFRQISVGIETACAIERPAVLYCWDRDQAPLRMPGVSPAAVTMGYDLNLMNLQSGVRAFFDNAEAATISFVSGTDFPMPAVQMSGDDNSCVIALDGVVYCLGMDFDGSDGYGTNWAAIPAPSQPAVPAGIQQ